jgi:hypothetical protein
MWALLVIGVLTGCGKVAEKASEKAAEKAIESAMSKDGTQAKVDLSQGSAKITTTDAKGNTAQMEFSGAKVTEAELGVPTYPGARSQQNANSRIQSPEGSMVSASFESKDSSEKVAAFYRDQLKQKSAGKQFMDTSTGDGSFMLMLADQEAKSQLQIQIGKADAGSSILIVSTRSTK